ncbi:aminoglycoside phosphotransferase [Streptococcus pneumoniae]|nr:aminoglycoside phosphotransferase [Streptococcus pneumoniae]
MDLGDNELTLTPIPGKSGKAYMGSYPDGKRIFVKMNTSPILPGLAREQIAPQLLWSRRLADGRDMCAQEWLTGKILTPYDMNRKQIVNILTRLHRSRPLMTQLSRLGYAMETPVDLLQSWQETAPDAFRKNHFISEVMADLRQTIPGFREDHATIVHGDVRHSNWIETDSGLFYLVDWDSVRLTDRMFDVAHMLCHYISEHQWKEWLTYYGYKYNQTVLSKLYWYGQLSYLSQISKYYMNQDLENVNREIHGLRHFRDKYGKRR